MSRVPASECPKPYFHPLRNLHGDVITNFRPNDHPWHQGLAMTMTVVNRTNFWGGVTYRKEDGKYRLRDNVGSQNHLGWTEKSIGESSVRLVERIGWNNEKGLPYLVEQRVIEAQVFTESACWRLRLCCGFENVSGQSLRLGTYESEEGLAGSHYTGIFFRLSRDFFGKGEKPPLGSYLAEGQRGLAAIHGTPSAWMACVGTHDNSDATTTVICCDHPGNPNFPTRWFYRPGMPSLAMPFTSSQALVLEPSAHLNLRCDVIIADGALEADAAKRLIALCGAQQSSY